MAGVTSENIRMSGAGRGEDEKMVQSETINMYFFIGYFYRTSGPAQHTYLMFYLSVIP